MNSAYEKIFESRFWITDEGFGLNGLVFAGPFPLSELTHYFGCEPSLIPGPTGAYVYARWKNSNIEATIDLRLGNGPLVVALNWFPKDRAYWIEYKSDLQFEFTSILLDEFVVDDCGKIRPSLFEKRVFGVRRVGSDVYWNERGFKAERGRIWAQGSLGSNDELTVLNVYLVPLTGKGDPSRRSASMPDYSIEVRDQNSYRKGFQMEVGEQLAKLTIGLLRAIITTLVVVGFAWWLLNKLIPINQLLESFSQ